MELIFIGDKFYYESGTIMSSIYTVDGRRCDWGFVQRELKAGKSIHIRPATEKELIPYTKQLATIKQR